MSHYDDIYLHDTAREDDTQERIDKRLAELLADPAAVFAAYEDIAGTRDTTRLEAAAFAPSQMNADRIPGSDALAAVISFGKGSYPALVEKLTERAEADVAEAAAFRPDMGEAA